MVGTDLSSIAARSSTLPSPGIQQREPGMQDRYLVTTRSKVSRYLFLQSGAKVGASALLCGDGGWRTAFVGEHHGESVEMRRKGRTAALHVGKDGKTERRAPLGIIGSSSLSSLVFRTWRSRIIGA